MSRFDRATIRAAAAAIANVRGGRRGAPALSNILEVLEKSLPKLFREVMEDAEAALEAAIPAPGRPPGESAPRSTDEAVKAGFG
jgi:hypothetical protein